MKCVDEPNLLSSGFRGIHPSIGHCPLSVQLIIIAGEIKKKKKNNNILVRIYTLIAPPKKKKKNWENNNKLDNVAAAAVNEIPVESIDLCIANQLPERILN